MAILRRDLPTGTVTFLRTDVEGSMTLARRLGRDWDEVNVAHIDIVRRCVDEHEGVTVRTEGDALFAVFPEAGAAASAAIDAQRALTAHAWPEAARVRVRMGLHSGEAHLAGDDYGGFEVNRAARIAASGHGGQIVLSESTRSLAEPQLPQSVSFRDLGRHQLKDVPRPERLFQLEAPGLPTDFPPLRTAQPGVGNLPVRLTSFLGRERERRELATALQGSRLVTITGPGGTGKTSLALAVAADVAAEFEDGTWFVALDGIREADLVPGAIARSLRLEIEDRGTSAARVLAYVADRRLLLVLDNLEQLEGTAGFVGSLLLAAPGLRVLAASQVPLHLGGEQEYRLGPLLVEPEGAEPAEGRETPQELGAAVQLFVERARAVDPAFELAGHRDAVFAVCARLDGLPLAIELAAAQTRLLSPAAILERLGTRIELLQSRRGDLPERQRTLAGAVAWSYELLPDSEKAMLRLLSAFAGGARLGEIEAVAEAVPGIPDGFESLAVLVDRSLVQRRHGPDDRFALLETIRSFAAGRLSEHREEATTFRGHAEVYAELAERVEPQLYRSGRRRWLDVLSADHDNVRVALDRMEAANEHEIALRIVAALWRFWQLTGHLDEAEPRVHRILDAAEASGRTLPPDLLSRAEEAAGGIAYWRRNEDVARIEAHYQKSLAYARASGDPARIAWATYNLSFTYDYIPAAADSLKPDRERAIELRSDALRLFREARDDRGVGYCLWSMGGSPLALAEEPDVARRHVAEALALMRGVDDAYGETWALVSLAMIQAVDGRIDEARAAMAEAATLFVRDGDLSGQMVILDTMASLAARGGDPRLAVRLDAAAAAARRATGVAIPAIPPLRGPIAAAREALDAAAISEEEEAGRSLSAEAILEGAMAALGTALPRALGDFGAEVPAKDPLPPLGSGARQTHDQ